MQPDSTDTWLASFEAFLEVAPDAMIVVDRAGVICAVNSQTEKIFGYSRKELLGNSIELLVPERLHAEHVHYRDNYVRTPKIRSMGTGQELFGRKKDGSEFSVEISLSPIESPIGLLISSAVRDISDRRRAEQRFRSLLESAPDAMVIVDRAGTIVLINSQTEELFGYPRKELLGQPVEKLVPTRFRERHFEYRDGYIAAPKVRAMGAGRQLFGLRKDGTEFPVEISLSPIGTEEGVLVSSAIRDITPQKELETRLQEASRMKSEFLANMSHELRTPLNGIIGFSEFLCDQKPGPLNTKQQEYLQDILNSSRHLLQLINDVLDLSKVEAGKMRIHPAAVSVQRVVDEVCASVAALAGKKEIQLIKAVDVAADTVTVDEQKLKQVLYNLVSNAVKFTSERGRVVVRCSRADDGTLAVAVEDNGIGIAREDIARLFREFEQLDSSTARLYQGTGLGLALVKKLVELQNGTVNVESELGKGSTFSITIPLADTHGPGNADETVP